MHLLEATGYLGASRTHVTLHEYIVMAHCNISALRVCVCCVWDMRGHGTVLLRHVGSILEFQCLISLVRIVGMDRLENEVYTEI